MTLVHGGEGVYSYRTFTWMPIWELCGMGYLCDCGDEWLAKWLADSVSVIDHELCPGIDTTQKTWHSFRISVFTRYNSGEMEVS